MSTEPIKEGTATQKPTGEEEEPATAPVQKKKAPVKKKTAQKAPAKKAAPAPAQSPTYSGDGRVYSSFTTFYPQAYKSVYGGRNTATLTTVVLETNLYSSETLELVWSMSSDTIEPRSIDKLAGSVSKTVISTLKKDGLL